jgi:hypothetical protein
MKASDHIVLAHHQPAATMWGRGGRDYDEVSFAISDALAHSANAGEIWDWYTRGFGPLRQLAESLPPGPR